MDNVDKWLTFYNSSNIEIKKRALAQIVKLNDPRITPILIDGFENLALQGFGASLQKAMVRVRDPRFVQPLIQLTEHTNHQMRGLACETLGRLGDKRATPALIICLDDPHRAVRWRAASAFTLMRDPAAIPALMRRHIEHAGDDINVTINVRRALEDLGAVTKPNR